MRGVLHDAKQASEQAAAAGLDRVPEPVAAAIRARYRKALTQADAALPVGSPPKRRNRGWFHRDCDAWNLAQRFRREHDQILRLLDDTRIPANNNDAERSLRTCKLHDKIAGCFRNPHHAEAFCTIRSYIQTGLKQHQNTRQPHPPLHRHILATHQLSTYEPSGDYRRPNDSRRPESHHQCERLRSPR